MTNLNLTLITEAEIEYRSSAVNSDNWCSALAKDGEGNTYKVWFEMVNDCEDLEDCCNWDDLSDYELIEEAPMTRVFAEDMPITDKQADKLAGFGFCFYKKGGKYYYSETAVGNKYPIDAEDIGELIDEFNPDDEEEM